MDALYSYISKTVQIVNTDELPDAPPQDAMIPLSRFLKPIEPENHLLYVYRREEAFIIENQVDPDA